MSLQKFLKGKSGAVRVAHLHSAARALSSPSRRKILTMIYLVVFCAEMLEQFSPASKGYYYHVLLSHSETLHCENNIDKEF